MSKRTLTVQDLDAQTAVELPDRDMMLVTVVLNNILNNNTVTITLRDIDLALQLCAQLVASESVLQCDQ